MKRGKNPEEKIKKFEQICAEKGIRLTHQRVETFRVIARFEGHPSVEDIYSKLKSRLSMISLDTVYRTLTTFEKAGIIAKVPVLDNKGRFDSNLIPHHHLICTQCKGIIDFFWPTFDKIRLPSETKKWGEIRSKQVELRGICDNCLKKAQKRKQ